MYQDAKKEWRWVYYAGNGEEIAVSSESYKSKSDCQHGVDIMRQSSTSKIYSSKETPH
ncbi:YegP family protein [Alsobacter sp. SYSU M60028]|uniref:YegP family protein n=2 Tax=Alsobacter ponti TaxID=2962936 RepID=A0ABT1LHQ2_9HYPH|nr:YegP family protein [Alsobacter ponti]